ncbi:MAG TPA: tRNA (cytidine(34)-2'-O)-methyltransferase [Alphaproteobacteria bacterium]
MPRLALYQPDIPQNTGAAVRLCAALGVALDIIEPCGFALSDQALRRVAMDYAAKADITRHSSWDAFQTWRAADQTRRLILLTTKSDVPYTEFLFLPNDILMLGRESAGAPDEVHAACDARLTIPVVARSLNIMMAGAMALGEALRQTDGFKG